MSRKSLFMKQPGFVLLVIFFFFLCLGLGFWQLARAKEKEQILQAFHQRIQQPALTAAAMSPEKDQRFYRVHLSGYFDNAHNLLLDNKTQKGRVGYEVYTPFIARGLSHPILIDRGFIASGPSRRFLPNPPEAKEREISGMLNQPPHQFALGQMLETQVMTWPLRIQYLDLNDVSHIFGHSVYPYILILDDPGAANRPTNQQIVAMTPERHNGYAFQWFALATTLLILFVVLNRHYTDPA